MNTLNTLIFTLIITIILKMRQSINFNSRMVCSGSSPGFSFLTINRFSNFFCESARHVPRSSLVIHYFKSHEFVVEYYYCPCFISFINSVTVNFENFFFNFTGVMLIIYLLLHPPPTFINPMICSS